MKVSLSILTVDYYNVEKSLASIVNDIDYLHLDVMDGEFVPNISFGYSFVASLKKKINKPFDTHLMIKHPQNYIENFVKAGSDYITFHTESDCDVMETINLIKSYGIKAGISIKPKTKVEEIKKYLPYVDMILIMSVEPGFGGQKFMMDSVDKVRLLKELREENGYSYLINIDGGVNDKTAPYISEYVDLAVSGSYVVNADSPKDNLEKLKNI
ncbi:MAG: ribulose-phosphate 3-epimerase [Acholeplasmatales bacterium]|nr:ribulose-phosphate 3-epimerase [Acholeplasmatales bacterium]